MRAGNLSTNSLTSSTPLMTWPGSTLFTKLCRIRLVASSLMMAFGSKLGARMYTTRSRFINVFAIIVNSGGRRNQVSAAILWMRKTTWPASMRSNAVSACSATRSLTRCRKSDSSNLALGSPILIEISAASSPRPLLMASNNRR